MVSQKDESAVTTPEKGTAAKKAEPVKSKETVKVGGAAKMKKSAKAVKTEKADGMIKKVMAGLFVLLLSGSIFLGACGASASAPDEQGISALTPGETAECVMESLKSLDLEQFNAYTDNHVETWHNWLGVPVESEYRVFTELLQPGAKRGYRKKNYEFNYKLNEKLMEYLSWEIGDVKERGDQAEIAMSITNLDMSLVTARYEISLWENMLESAENGKTGFGQMVKDLSMIADDEGGLFSVMESCSEEDICTFQVTVTAYREDDMWKLHLDEEFINAILGNINEESYPEELQQKIEELEKQYEEELDEWEKQFTEKWGN